MLLKEVTPRSVPDDDVKVKNIDEQHFGRIRCPLCKWRPTASSMWVCIGRGTPEPSFNGCGTTWNTFKTRGRCPGCQHQWVWTSCHKCRGWSLHEDWYEESET